ncbi:MAG: methionyl-tRNA formyltransferase [Nitrospinales bacterium]
MKIVYMGTPAFALPTLQALCRSGHRVLGVVTQPDRPRGRGRELQAPPVKQFAVDAGIKVFQPANAGAPEFVEILRSLAPDCIIVAAFGQILKPAIVDHWFCMNLHASLLPRYRGAAPINRAIINGDSETGITTMKMDRGLDTGGILLKQTIEIGESDDAQTLRDALAEAGASLVLETLSKLEDHSLIPTPQDHSQATYAPKLTKEDGQIFWDKEAGKIRNLVRGLVPWPGAFTFFKSRRIRVVRAETAPGAPEDQAGAIARVSDHGIEVGTAAGRLVITELQPEGKKIMRAQAFLQGHAMRKGDRFDPWPHSETTNAA